MEWLEQKLVSLLSTVHLDPKDWVLLAIPLSLTGLGFILRYSMKHVQNLLISRHYRLSGSYLTFYDDPTLDGRGFRRAYAESKIKQRGEMLAIRTEDSRGRIWIHKGYIVKDRFISGWYQARDPHDTGVGTFFLQIKDMDSLEGTWHGHDHEGNRNIVSGLYKFRKKTNVHIEPIRTRDIASVLRIADRSFGAHYVTLDVLNQPGSEVLVAVKDRDVVGFCISYFLKPQDFRAVFGKSAISNEVLRYADATGKIGIIKSIAVDAESRSLGVGTQLFIAAERALFEKNAAAIVVPLWYWQENASLQNIAELNEYVFLSEDKEHWKTDCLLGRFRCVARTGPECVCSCRFYYKTPSR